ncbi:MAG: hypothetical protein ACRD29_21190 [Acidimicrobiales bacterium]
MLPTEKGLSQGELGFSHAIVSLRHRPPDIGRQTVAQHLARPAEVIAVDDVGHYGVTGVRQVVRLGDEVAVGRDVDHVTVQTWVSGVADMEIGRHHQPAIPNLHGRRIAAELLANAIEEQARAGPNPDDWEPNVALLEPTTA